jgi:predicted nucleotidyltransferase
MGTKERWKGFRELPPDIIQGLKRLVPLFERENVLLAYLFGSLGRGQEGNDVDLAILVQGRPAFCLRDAILDCLGTERVDLVDLQRAPPVLRFQIIRAGHPLYVSNQALQERFELATLHLYRDTRFLRSQQQQYVKERFAQWSSNERSSKSA